MRRAFSAFCCVIVCLQILIGVPLLVCIGFFTIVGGGLGQIAVDVHGGQAFASPATIPPPNLIPTAVSEPLDNPILTSRAAHGSPLAGTILADASDPKHDQDLFVAALEKVAIESACDSPHCPASCLPSTSESTSMQPATTRHTDDLVIEHLYKMADADEAAGNFDRADQWRAHAREIRKSSEFSSTPALAPASGL
jgi:hypothetical protein